MKSFIQSSNNRYCYQVLSGILLFGLVPSLYNGYHTQIVDATKVRHYKESGSGGNKDSTNSASSQTQQQQQRHQSRVQFNYQPRNYLRATDG